MSASDLPKTYMFVSMTKSMIYRRKHLRIQVCPAITTNLVDESVGMIGNYFSTRLSDGYQSKSVVVIASEQTDSFSPVTCTLEGRKTGKRKYEYTYTVQAYNCVPFITTYAKDKPLNYSNLARIVDSPDRV